MRALRRRRLASCIGCSASPSWSHRPDPGRPSSIEVRGAKPLSGTARQEPRPPGIRVGRAKLLLPIVLGAWWDFAMMARRGGQYRQEAADYLREKERLTGSPHR